MAGNDIIINVTMVTGLSCRTQLSPGQSQPHWEDTHLSVAIVVTPVDVEHCEEISLGNLFVYCYSLVTLLLLCCYNNSLRL